MSVTSLEKVQELRNAIQQGLDALPGQSAFGDSNANDKRLMRIWLVDLDRVLAGQSARTGGVTSWISGEDDHFLGDFLS